MWLQVPKPDRVEGEHLLSLLKMPSALAGRMAVAEASLQRLHGSPDALQPAQAGAGAGAGASAAQQPSATRAAEPRSAIQRWAEKVRQARSTSTAYSRCGFNPQERAARRHSMPLCWQRQRLSRGAVPP